MDQNDATKAQILEHLLHDIHKKYQSFREDVVNAFEILNNNQLEQRIKLDMMHLSKQLHGGLRKAYGLKSYALFKKLMENIVGLVLA